VTATLPLARREWRGLGAAFALVAAAFAIATLFRWDAFRHAGVLGLWKLFDWHDIHVYFLSSGWVAGQGTLYREVPSEYPLLANLLFALVRVISRVVRLATDYDRFAWTWVTITMALYLGLLHRLVTRYPRPAVLLWLTPSAIHFSLYRYDVFAVIAALFAVESLRADRLRAAALLLGLVAALKGYSLFLLPAFLYYAWVKRGTREAGLTAVIYVALFALGNLATLAFSGVDGLMYAYRFHATRTFNGESTYDAVTYVFGPAFRDVFARFPRLPLALQALGALLAVAFRPRTHEQLMRAFLFATTMFVSFSVFYSPQFVLWLVPFVAEWTMPVVSWLVVALSWVTFAYFPVAFFRKARHLSFFQSTVALTTAVRAVLLAAVVVLKPRGAAAGAEPAR
jgi:uncharacterized membrane protein